MTIDIWTIIDRTTYLAWRSDWRHRYADASEDVRAAKRALAAAIADLRCHAPLVGEHGHEHRINSIRERLPRQRALAHAVMSERQFGSDRRNELTGAARTRNEAMAA